jgi:hypothetical protein
MLDWKMVQEWDVFSGEERLLLDICIKMLANSIGLLSQRLIPRL